MADYTYIRDTVGVRYALGTQLLESLTGPDFYIPLISGKTEKGVRRQRSYSGSHHVTYSIL